MSRALHRRDDLSRADGPDRTELDCAALFYRDGQSEERRFLLEDSRPRRLVGRSPRCDLMIDWDDLVSREHAWLELVGERWLVSDDGLSRNGTYLNGERLTSGRRPLSRS